MHEHFEFGRHGRGFRRGMPGFMEGEGEHRGGGGRWGGGRGFGRPFDHGELRFVILALIAEKPRHGYEIIKAIEEQFGGSYTPSPGVVYPTLTMLEESGNATVEEIGGKKSYTITDQGKEFLAANRASTDAAMGRMREHGSHEGAGRAPQLVRAVENLKLALRLRQRSGPLSEEQMHVIVAALDAAAVAIERS
jgi:DNA-binding PadR family transcriptional regulator